MAESEQQAMLPVNPLVLGKFSLGYDMPVMLLWLFIFVAGLGNWLTFWNFMKTKELQTVFNVISLTLCFANGLMTSIVSPMELGRIVMAYPEVSMRWCRVKPLLMSFSSIVSIIIIFILGALRLRVTWANQAMELTKIKVYTWLIITFIVAIVCAPLLMLEGSTESIRSCMGRVRVDILGPESIGEYTLPSNISTEATTTPMGVTETPVMTTFSMWDDNSSYDANTNSTISPVAAMSLSPRSYYLISTTVLLSATAICYLCLVVILKKQQNVQGCTTLGNDMDILTLRVMAYVTCSFFVCFLVPFVPVLIHLPPQRTIMYMHYMSIFRCLSCMDGALNPFFCYHVNDVYRKALQKVLPYSVRKLFCESSVTPDIGYHSNGIQIPEMPLP